MKVAEIGRFSARCLTCETTWKLSPKSCLNGYNFKSILYIGVLRNSKRNFGSISALVTILEAKTKTFYFLPCRIPSFFTPDRAHKLRDCDTKTTI